MSRVRKELVVCPVCDPERQVYAFNCENNTGLRTFFGHHEIRVNRDQKAGWCTCPLCRTAGWVPKAVWVAFKLRFDARERPHLNDIREFLAAYALEKDCDESARD